jgi:L-cysteine:1D-myo-inositol 2-amino-2-deoxy-alpha-D-glucopyranoside ligase
MQLYNALSQRKEEFEPNGDKVTIYVCGITPYDTTHLGHAFTYATFDVLIRYLEYSGVAVKYTQNVTDIDDDILKKSKQVGENWQDLGDHWTLHFIDDNIALNYKAPDFFPRATDVIADIINTVQTLLSVGVAYESNGNVYFSIEKDPDYGKLSRLTYSEMLPIANERGNNPDDPNKRDPLDFVLWQAHEPGEPSWSSPWGRGRPGWHIECSTMSQKFLGQSIDIHGGGADLIFPHHESEIAQSECATGRHPFTRFWMHVAMVHYQGEKMSKSLGNLVMVRQLLESGYQADALRLCMNKHHYREAWTYDRAELDESTEQIEMLQQALTVRGGSREDFDAQQTRYDFVTAMNDDLDTPRALETVFKLADEIIAFENGKWDITNAQETLRELAGILGLRLDDTIDPKVERGWQRHRRRFESG